MIKTFIFWLCMSINAEKKSIPKGPGEPSPSPKEKKLQMKKQLEYAEKAILGMKQFGITTGYSWNKAHDLKRWAIFGLEAMASPWPEL